MFDQALFMANAPLKLQEAQKLLEDATEAFGEYSDQEAQCTRKYRERRATCVKRLYAEKNPVTIIQDLAKGECAAEKEALMRATDLKKKALLMADNFRERIYNIRYLCKTIDSNIKT